MYFLVTYNLLNLSRLNVLTKHVRLLLKTSNSIILIDVDQIKSYILFFLFNSFLKSRQLKNVDQIKRHALSLSSFFKSQDKKSPGPM